MPTLQEPFGFLLAVVNRRKGLLFRSLLSPAGITPRQYGILSRLWERDGMTLSDLAERLYADPTALSRTLHAMEESGLLRRLRDESDRRVHHFYLTDYGRDLGFSLRPAVSELNETIVRDFSYAEKEMFRHLLKRVMKNLEGPIPPESSEP